MAVGNGMETYAARLASFSIAHPAKKRGSDTKGTKTLKWPLKNLSPDEVGGLLITSRANTDLE